MIKKLLAYIELISIIIASGFEHVIFHGPKLFQFYEKINPIILVKVTYE